VVAAGPSGNADDPASEENRTSGDQLAVPSPCSTTSDHMSGVVLCPPTAGPGESSVLLVGDQEAGRTSLVSVFLNPHKGTSWVLMPAHIFRLHN
jgi:hypothetical protein